MENSTCYLFGAKKWPQTLQKTTSTTVEQDLSIMYSRYGMEYFRIKHLAEVQGTTNQQSLHNSLITQHAMQRERVCSPKTSHRNAQHTSPSTDSLI